MFRILAGLMIMLAVLIGFYSIAPVFRGDDSAKLAAKIAETEAEKAKAGAEVEKARIKAEAAQAEMAHKEKMAAMKSATGNNDFIFRAGAAAFFGLVGFICFLYFRQQTQIHQMRQVYFQNMSRAPISETHIHDAELMDERRFIDSGSGERSPA